MKPVHAFVGHSFTSDDALVVDAFLKYLTAIAEMHPMFTWQHAERAEPRLIDEKVLELFADKTLFIAICTRKERAVSPAALGKSFLWRGRLAADQAAFEWKTSDWIIQEIGLAIGLGLPVILLVEDGVRSPGGLQGNLEYIGFTRSAPEKAFPKLLEMVGSLSPREKGGGQVAAATTSTSDDGQKPEEHRQDDAWTSPSPDWNVRQYEFSFMHFAAVRDEAGARRVSDAFLISSAGGDEEARRTWAAYCERTRIEFDAGGKIQRLVALATEHPTSPGTLENLARGYVHYEEYLKAAETFEQAANSARDATHAIRLLREAAVAVQKAGDGARSVRLVDRMRKAAQDDRADPGEILEAEGQLAEFRKEDDIQIATLEAQLEDSPEDAQKRFALAYKYSDTEKDDLAVLHYERIAPSDRSGVTWNNLAVSLDRLGVPGKSVEAYRRAEGHGETLAMSNLALKLMGAGFVDEAKEICERAIAIKDHHQNVDTSLGRLKALPDEEEKKESAVLERARPTSAFYREFGAALTRPLPATLAKVWHGPDCLLEVTFETEKLTARGTYERARSGLIAAMMMSQDATSRPEGGKDSVQVEYVAKARGSALVGQVRRVREGEVLKKAASTLLTQEENPTVLLVVGLDGKSIRVMERSKNSSSRIYGFTATE